MCSNCLTASPLEFEFLDFSSLFERHTQPFIKNLKLMGVNARQRIVDAAQFKQRLDSFDFDVVVDNLVMGWSPGEELRAYFSSRVGACGWVAQFAPEFPIPSSTR